MAITRVLRLGLTVLWFTGLTFSDANAQAPLFQTKRCNPLPDPRQMHGCAVVGTRLYIMGGNNDAGFRNDVISAEIQQDGNLGTWRPETSLPEYRRSIGTSVEVVNNRIYVIGGATVPSATSTEAKLVRANDVLWTTVDSAGALQEWKRSDPFDAAPLSCIGTCSDDKHLYVVGGNGTSAISSNVITCDFSPEGAPVNWRSVSQMPIALWFQGSAILNGKMFVWGGLTAKTPASASNRVLAAPVKEDGTLGDWAELPVMTKPIYSSAFCGFNDHLVAVAGRYIGGVGTNDIMFSRLESGTPQAWQLLSSDLDVRIYPSLGLDKSRGWIFVTGGRAQETGQAKGTIAINAIQAFQITQPKASSLILPSAGSAVGQPAFTAPNGISLVKLGEAFQNAKAQRKNVAMFFYSPETPACKRQWDAMMSSPAVAAAASKYVWTAVDVSKEDKSYMYKYIVFKVPAIVIADPEGTALRTDTSLKSPEQILSGP
ncbi:MAG: hypothetical protein ACR2IE_03020 [Candidatus Sumerlaeaceae bacterium]